MLIIQYVVCITGTLVSMMTPRDRDYDVKGYKEWPFMSVQTWGERPHGNWLLKVWDDVSKEIRCP